MNIYISIPISGKDLSTQQALAAQIAERIKALGHEAVNLFDTPLAPPEWSEQQKYAYCMGRDVKRLLMCDAILMCQGWAESRGCKIELNAAAHCGLEQYFSLAQIPEANK